MLSSFFFSGLFTKSILVCDDDIFSNIAFLSLHETIKKRKKIRKDKAKPREGIIFILMNIACNRKDSLDCNYTYGTLIINCEKALDISQIVPHHFHSYFIRLFSCYMHGS